MVKFFKLVMALFIVSLGYCCTPVPRPQIEVEINRYSYMYEHNITIAFDDSFKVPELETMGRGLSTFEQQLDRTFLVVSSTQRPDVLVRNWREPHNPRYLGYYYTNSNYILIDVDHIYSEEQLQATFMHELGHWFGMRHICLSMEEAYRSDDCSPVGYGVAIMNHAIQYERVSRFTDLDIQEFHRSRIRNR